MPTAAPVPWADPSQPAGPTPPAGPIAPPAGPIPPAGPAARSTFSLEGRAAPGLYLVAWVLAVAGVVIVATALTLVDARGEPLRAWAAYGVVAAAGALVLMAALGSIGKHAPAGVLAAVLAALALRLILGATLLRVLPVWGYPTKPQQAGYVYWDSYKRDTEAWAISRMVPGMGEECLAILGRGEVFGELALVDDQPRSADARAHAGPCTVFSINRGLLEEVLSMDPDAAVQFLNLLCRLLCRRLRAMNERLVAWRVMGSHV